MYNIINKMDDLITAENWNNDWYQPIFQVVYCLLKNPRCNKHFASVLIQDLQENLSYADYKMQNEIQACLCRWKKHAILIEDYNYSEL